MKFLLDTNVVSEMIKTPPNAAVAAWLAAADEEALFLSVITLTEIKHGVERLAEGKRREALEAWVRESLEERFRGRIIHIDEGVAGVWAKIISKSESSGRRMSIMDGFQAACAEAHGLILVTRDEQDFQGFPGQVMNPWNFGS